MSQYGYLWIKSRKDGVIEGYTGEKEPLIGGKGTEKMSRIVACDHSMHVQTNPESGETRGMMQNGTFNLQVDIDQAIALLYKNFIEGTPCEVEIYLMQIGKRATAGGEGSGNYENYCKVVLKDARLARVTLTKPPVYTGNDMSDLLDISFSYGEFQIEHKDGKSAEWKFTQKAG